MLNVNGKLNLFIETSKCDTLKYSSPYSIKFVCECICPRCSRIFVSEPKKIPIANTTNQSQMQILASPGVKTSTVLTTASPMTPTTTKVFTADPRQKKDASDHIHRKIQSTEIARYLRIFICQQEITPS